MENAKVRDGAVVSVVIDEKSNAIVFSARGAAPDGGAKYVTLELSKVHADNVNYAALHGFNQRVRDAAAQSKNQKTGASATPAEKFDAMERLVLHYMSGAPEWNLRAASGERTSGDVALLIRAIMELKSKEYVEIKAWVDGKSRAEREAIMLSDAVKPLIDGYRSERAANVDADALLAELG